MTNWRSSGHATRRRAGAPSNHFDSVGIGGRVNLPTPEEAIAGMARVGSPRIPMGMSAILDFANAEVIPPLKGTQVPKTGNAKGATPWGPPTGVRENVDFRSERSGASYRVNAVGAPTIDPAAGATQANGRIVPSALAREDSFDDGMMGAYKGY